MKASLFLVRDFSVKKMVLINICQLQQPHAIVRNRNASNYIVSVLPTEVYVALSANAMDALMMQIMSMKSEWHDDKSLSEILSLLNHKLLRSN